MKSSIEGYIRNRFWRNDKYKTTIDIGNGCRGHINSVLREIA